MGNGLGAMVFIVAGIALGYAVVTNRLGSFGKAGTAPTAVSAPGPATASNATTQTVYTLDPNIIKNSVNSALNAAGGSGIQTVITPGW